MSHQLKCHHFHKAILKFIQIKNKVYMRVNISENSSSANEPISVKIIIIKTSLVESSQRMTKKHGLYFIHIDRLDTIVLKYNSFMNQNACFLLKITPFLLTRCVARICN